MVMQSHAARRSSFRQSKYLLCGDSKGYGKVCCSMIELVRFQVLKQFTVDAIRRAVIRLLQTMSVNKAASVSQSSGMSVLYFTRCLGKSVQARSITKQGCKSAPDMENEFHRSGVSVCLGGDSMWVTFRLAGRGSKTSLTRTIYCSIKLCR